MNDFLLKGPGYQVRVPKEFELEYHDPNLGRALFNLPAEFSRSAGGMINEFLGMISGTPTPGMNDTGAHVSVHPLSKNQIRESIHEQTLWDNPQFSSQVGPALGIPTILSAGPVRVEKRKYDNLYLRDIEGINMVGTHLRLTSVIVAGAQSGVESYIFMGIAVWTKYIGSCLRLIAGIDVTNGKNGIPVLQAVIDKSNQGQIEYQFKNPDNTTTPLTSVPTIVHNHYVVNIDQSIKAGNINGTGVVVGHHSISRVKS